MKKIFILPLLILVALSAKAQKGQFIDIWGGPQLVTLNNYNDYNPTIVNNTVDRVTTYRYTLGLDYINNFTPAYGFQTGLYYSQAGQKYSGTIAYDYDKKDSLLDTSAFESHVYLNYLKIPLMIRFNSELDEDERMNLTVFMGLEISILQKFQESYSIVHAPTPYETFYPNNQYTEKQLRGLYKKVTTNICAGLQLNERITKRLGAFAGIRFSRSLGNIENLGYNFPAGFPVELKFPVSVKKSSPPDLLVRYPTKVTSVAAYIGLSMKLSGE
jgi:hypothetical protein